MIFAEPAQEIFTSSIVQASFSTVCLFVLSNLKVTIWSTIILEVLDVFKTRDFTIPM